VNRDAYGTMAAFASEEAFLGALRSLRDAGYRRVDTFTPYAVEEAERLLPPVRTPIPWIMLAAGILGGGGAFFMQWYACRDYPLNVGGKPLDSWPAFVPVTFELTVLSAALAGVAGFLWLAGFPRLDHPAFSDGRFRRASQDRFFVCIRSDDPRYSRESARDAFRATEPESVEEVPA
jgi:hypothetical protein